MINYLTPGDLEKMGVAAKPVDVPPAVEITEPVGVVVEATVTRRPTEAMTHLTRSDEAWGWEELRDYVVAQIEQRNGPFPRDGAKESGIFKRFCSTWGAEAPAIARYAFEVCDGRWAGAPIRVQRFCKGSDAFFAQPIAERIRATAV